MQMFIKNTLKCWILLMLSLVVVSACASVASGSKNEPIVFSEGNYAWYTVDGEHNKTLTLTRGQTYTIQVNVPGHPLWIKTQRGALQENAYNTGVTGNGTAMGEITFTVPMDAPKELFYNCEYHPAMGGSINIVDAMQ